MTLVRKINNLYQNFASIDAIFEGPSQVLQGVHDVYTVVSKVAEDIYSVVKGVQEVTPNTTSNLTLYIYRSSSLEAARRSVGISKLLYKIAQRDQRDNPFNAETKISYSLPNASDAYFDIYNLMGQKIETLFEGHQQAGEHSVMWDAKGFSSGIYFYRLAAGDKVFTKRMALLK